MTESAEIDDALFGDTNSDISFRDRARLTDIANIG